MTYNQDNSKLASVQDQLGRWIYLTGERWQHITEGNAMLNSIHITYDTEGDTFYIAFGNARPAAGYQLSDQILLRMDPESDTPAGLTIGPRLPCCA